MDFDLTLGESYPWLEDVLTSPIDKAGMLLFSQLGYYETVASAMLGACPGKAFVYSLLPEERLLNDLDTIHMHANHAGSHLFNWSSEAYAHKSDPVSIYAVDMEDVGYARSDEAYAIHRIISKFSARWSIVLFRHRFNLLLSFLEPTDKDRYAIYLSDWVSLESPDEGQLERIHVANTSLGSPVDCFDGFMYEAIRPYYKHPITRASAIYSILDTMNVSTKIDLPLISRDVLNAAADEAMSHYLDLYGDDYLEDKDLEIDADDDFNLEDVEWELENAVSETTEDSEEGQMRLPLSFDETPTPLPAYDDIPDDVMDNPINLLKWMEDHPGPSAKVAKITEDQKRFHIASTGTQPPKVGSYVRHISLGKGTVAWPPKFPESYDVVGNP